jgi:hypothetical protein
MARWMPTAAALLLLVGPAGTAGAVPTTVDFEHDPPTDVRIAAGAITAESAARSPTHVLEATVPAATLVRVLPTVALEFSEPQLWIRLYPVLVSPGSATAELVALDGSGNAVAKDAVVLGPDAGASATPLFVRAGTASIAAITVRFSGVTTAAIDDAAYSTVDAAPVVSLDPPPPATVDRSDLTLTGKVVEDVELDSLTLSLDGGTPQPVEFQQEADGAYAFSAQVALQDGENAIGLVATDSAGQTGSTTASVRLAPPPASTSTATSTPTATSTSTSPSGGGGPSTATASPTTGGTSNGFAWGIVVGSAAVALALIGATLAVLRARRIRFQLAAEEREPTGPCDRGWRCRRGPATLQPARRHVDRLVLNAPGLDPLELEGELPESLRPARRSEELQLQLLPTATALLEEVGRWAGAERREVTVEAHVEGGKAEFPFELWRCRGGRWRKVREWKGELAQSERHVVTTLAHPGTTPAALAGELARFVEELRSIGLPSGATSSVSL